VQINLEPFVDHLYRFALSLTRDADAADELTQNCLLKAIQKKSQLENPDAVKAWLFQIMVNLWKDQIKKKQLAIDQSADVHWLVHDDPTPEQQATEKETKAGIFEMIQTLPTRQRTVLYLSIVEQLSINEIANTLDISANAAKASLSIGRKSLRKLLVKKGMIEEEPAK